MRKGRYKQTSPPIQLRVWGELACFSRPELKVERVSYEVPTPAAARGILEAIFWNPTFSWQIRQIWVHTPIRYIPLMRNEVQHRVSVATATRFLDGEQAYCVENDRTQRNTLCLRDVAYTIVAVIVVRPDTVANALKCREQFRRAVRQGECYHVPYLGCREFPAFFSFEPPETFPPHPYPLDMDLGWMLFDMSYDPDQPGRGVPRFFQASLHGGVLTVPEELYQIGEGHDAS